MNGVLILSLDSGLLIYATKNLHSFGFSQAPAEYVDGMQLSATIFAMYKAAPVCGADASCGREGACLDLKDKGDKSLIVNPPSISWVEQGGTAWVFHDFSYTSAAQPELGVLQVLIVGSFLISMNREHARLMLCKLAEHYVKKSRPKEPCPKLNIYPAIYQSLSEIFSRHYRDRGASQRRVYICSRRDWPLIASMCSDDDAPSPSQGNAVRRDEPLQHQLIEASSIFDDEEKPPGFLPPIPLPSRADQPGAPSISPTLSQPQLSDTGDDAPPIQDSVTLGVTPPTQSAIESSPEKLEITGSTRSKTRPAEPPPVGRNRTPRWRRLFSFGKKTANSDNNLLSKNIFSSTLTGGLPRTDSEPKNLKLNSYQSFDQFRAMPHRDIASDPPVSSPAADKSGVKVALDSMYHVFLINDVESSGVVADSRGALFRETVRRFRESSSLGQGGDSADTNTNYSRASSNAVPGIMINTTIPDPENCFVSARVVEGRDVVYMYVECSSEAVLSGQARLPEPPRDWEGLSLSVLSLFAARR